MPFVPRPRNAALIAAALALCPAVAIAQSGGVGLRGSMPGACGAEGPCGIAVPAPALTQPRIDSVETASIPPAPVVAAAPAGPFVGAAPMHFDPTPAWKTEWRLGLRGSYVVSDGAGRLEAVLVPGLSSRFNGSDRRMALDGEAQLALDEDGQVRIGGGDFAFTLDQRFNSDMRGTLVAGLSLFQDSALGLSQTLDTVARAPLEIDGRLEAGLERRFGHLETGLTLGVARAQTGDTELVGGGVVSNAHDNFIRYDGALRVAYALTPITSVFVSGEVGREEFDVASPDLGVFQSGWDYGLRGGVSFDWSQFASAEAWVGSRWREYDAAALGGAQALVYGGAVHYAPTSTLSLRASFEASLRPGSGGAVSRLDHVLALEAAYKVNSLVGLRGVLSASWEDPDTGAPVRRYGAGIGADIALGAMTTLNLDYGYGWRDDPAAATPVRDEHTISAGVTLRY